MSMYLGWCLEVRKGYWPPGARVIDGCEPSDMGAGNWSQILGQSSTCSLSVTEPLSSLLHGSLQEVPRLFYNQLIPFLSFVLEFHIQNPGLPLTHYTAAVCPSSCLQLSGAETAAGPHSSHAFMFWACSEKPGMVVHALTWQVGVWGVGVSEASQSYKARPCLKQPDKKIRGGNRAKQLVVIM